MGLKEHLDLDLKNLDILWKHVHLHVINILILVYNFMEDILEIQIIQSVFVKVRYNQSKDMDKGNAPIEEEVVCVM